MLIDKPYIRGCVVSRAPINHISASATAEEIIKFATDERVVTCSTIQNDMRARARGIQLVVAIIAKCNLDMASAEIKINSAATSRNHDIGTSTCINGLVRRVYEQQIVSSTCNHGVSASATV